MKSLLAWPHTAVVLICSILALLPLSAVFSQPPLRTNKPDSYREAVVDASFSYLGTPYVYGGMRSSGLDCSGLINLVYYDATGQRIPRTVVQLKDYAMEIPRDDLMPGDIVFYDTAGPLSHAGIYAGNGMLIHAASEYNRSGVVVSRFDRDYYQQRYHSAGRLLSGLDRGDMQRIVDSALSYVGTAYVFGGASPSGVDCSGFVHLVFRESLDHTPSRTVENLVREIEDVPEDDLRPGDLLFFNTSGPLSHVGIYIGGNQFVHAASETIRNGVIYSDMNAPYYRERYNSSARILPVEAIPWVLVRFMNGVESGLSPDSIELGLENWQTVVSSGVSLYFNTLGLVDPGIEFRALFSITDSYVSLPLSFNLMLNRVGWLRFSYELHPAVRSLYPLHRSMAFVPQVYSIGYSFPRPSSIGRSFGFAIEASYHALHLPQDAQMTDFLSLIRAGLYFSLLGEF